MFYIPIHLSDFDHVPTPWLWAIGAGEETTSHCLPFDHLEFEWSDTNLLSVTGKVDFINCAFTWTASEWRMEDRKRRRNDLNNIKILGVGDAITLHLKGLDSFPAENPLEWSQLVARIKIGAIPHGQACGLILRHVQGFVTRVMKKDTAPEGSAANVHQ